MAMTGYDGQLEAPATAGGALKWAIYLSSAGFIVILALAALWDHSIAWLHLFQALMYVAVIWFAARSSRWGYFLGISIAAFWNYGALFVNNFFRSGLRALEASFQTGALTRPDQMIAVFAVLMHLVLIAACLLAYLRLERRSAGDLARFAAAFLVSTAYFAASMALFQPRYLSLFPRMLHPHGLW
jgi:hypothetical protein